LWLYQFLLVYGRRSQPDTGVAVVQLLMRLSGNISLWYSWSGGGCRLWAVQNAFLGERYARRNPHQQFRHIDKLELSFGKGLNVIPRGDRRGQVDHRPRGLTCCSAASPTPRSGALRRGQGDHRKRRFSLGETAEAADHAGAGNARLSGRERWRAR